MDDPPADNIPAPRRLRAWPLIKWGLFLVVMYFVGKRAVVLWQNNAQAKVNVDLRWLVPAAVMYLVGWMPSVWFWRAMLKRMHQKVGWYDALRAYYVGHLGKYLPGKALVLVMRGSLLKEAGANPVFAGVTAAYETLMFMWSGAALAVALAPAAMPPNYWQQMPLAVQGLRQQVWLLPAIVLVATVGVTPFSAWLFTFVGRKALPRDPNSAAPPPFTASLMVQGACITSLGWLCHAVSLGCTLQAVSDRPFDLAHHRLVLALKAGAVERGDAAVGTADARRHAGRNVPVNQPGIVLVGKAASDGPADRDSPADKHASGEGASGQRAEELERSCHGISYGLRGMEAAGSRKLWQPAFARERAERAAPTIVPKPSGRSQTIGGRAGGRPFVAQSVPVHVDGLPPPMAGPSAVPLERILDLTG